MATSIVHKIGDSINWSFNYTQSSSVAVDLTNFVININAMSKTSVEAFNISSNAPTLNAFIDITDVINGNFELSIKDTSSFLKGDYFVDIEYTDLQGYRKSSKSFILKLVERL